MVLLLSIFYVAGISKSVLVGSNHFITVGSSALVTPQCASPPRHCTVDNDACEVLLVLAHRSSPFCLIWQ
jgi:hypothetical protein